MPSAQLHTKIYRSLDQLETIRGKWHDLLARYPLSTTFSTPEWLISWCRAFGNNQELFVVAMFDADSQLVAIAPLSFTRIRFARMVPFNLLRFMGDGTQDSDNLDLPVRPGFDGRFAASLLECLEQERFRWDFAEFNTMPSASPAGLALKRLLTEKQWLVSEKKTLASRVTLPPAWDEYLRQLSNEDRKNLERYARRIEKRYAVKMYRCSEEAQIPKCLEAMFLHHQARWEAAGEPGSFGSVERRSFYHDLSRQLLQRGELDLWAIELDGQVVAAQFGFRYGNQVFQLQEGNDPNHASDRVGFLLRGHVLKELIGQGIQTYDFLGGELGYKARWGARPGHYLNLKFARPLTPGAAYLQAQSYAGRSKAWLRQHLPATAWQMLHKLNVGVRKNRKESAPKAMQKSPADDPGSNPPLMP